MRKSLFIYLLMVLCHLSALAQTDGYNPSNPPNPTVPETEQEGLYRLTVATSPVGMGGVNTNGGEYREGDNVYLYAYYYSDLTFRYWIDDEGNVLSTNTDFYYTMPARNAQVTAVYSYNPQNPGNPDVPTMSYTLTLKAKPEGTGSFSPYQPVKVQQGTDAYLCAYTPNSDFKFVRWEDEQGNLVSTAQYFYYNMPAANTTLYGVFEYAPGNPANPGKNAWDSFTGQVIVDDFTPGNLSSAIYEAIGNNDASQVSQIIVAGKVSENDFSIANNFSNCTLVDLSRTTGVSLVPWYCYYGNNSLTQLVLPASISDIGEYAFYNCSSLAEITVYSVMPPAIGYCAFEGVPQGLTVYVPEGSIELYEAVEGWKDMIILPIRSNVHNLELNLPDECKDGRYKNMALELVNVKSGQKYKYVVTDRLNYIFSNLMKNTTYNAYLKNLSGVVLAEIDSIKIDEADLSLTFSNMLTLQNVKLSVLTPDDTDVTSQVGIRWFDANDKLLSYNPVVEGQVEGYPVKYAINLPQSLAMQYLLPADSVYMVNAADNNITCRLEALPQMTLQGRVVDLQTQEPIAKATITASQTINGKYTKAVVAKTDAQGAYALNVFAVPTKMTFAEQEHVSKNIELTDSMLALTEVNLGVVELKQIAGFTITTNFTYTERVEAGQQPVKQEGYDDYQNVAYTIYNKTQQKPVTQFSVQYPKIVLLEEVNENDVLQITAMSKNNAFNEVVVEVVADADNQTDATFDIVQLGAIKSVFSQTENVAVVAMLYDAAGMLVKKYKYETAALSIADLADGNYTLVSMGESDFFNTISNISSMTDIGLAEGVDYIKNAVSVKSGEVTLIKNAMVPFFDERKLYYTGDNTSFIVNKPSVVMGNYLTFTAKVDFKDVYASQVSDVSLIIDMPQESNYVNGSLMIGSKLGECSVDGNRIIVTANSLDELQKIRYCAVPSRSGEYSPTAYVKFTLAGKEIQQPIGSASYTVKDMSVNIPSSLAKNTFSVSGTATNRASIEVYDGLDIIGSTTALANGLWNVQCELVDPQPFSEHNLYAKIITKDGVEMQTETHTVTFNPYLIAVNKVQMINTAHGSGSLGLIDYTTVFDFQNPSLEKKTYWYWPSYPDFTFVADITSNDTTIIDRVYINVYTEEGNVTSLKANYNQTKDRWIATEKFYSGHLPINVSVTIDNCQYNLADTLQYKIVTDELLGNMDFQVETENEDSVVTNVFDENGEFVEQIVISKDDRSFENVVEEWVGKGYDKELETDSLTLMTDSVTGNSVFVLKDIDDVAPVRIVKVRLLTEYWRKTVLENVKDILLGPWRRKVDEKQYCPDGIKVATYEHGFNVLHRYTFLKITHYVLDTYLLGLAADNTILSHDLIFRLIVNIKRHYSKNVFDKVSQGMYDIISPINCTPPPPPPPPGDGDGGYVMDPSGYVYEGVESNRLQGVTATCYYKETVEDMYGDLHENIVLWDAEEYAQKNPLFTDENGMYAWDVPQGLWQVKFEKEGYQTTYSEWLPVPPPQLEVNIGMVQNVQPEVKAAKAYEDGVEIEFSKYMKPETLTADNLYLKLITGSTEEMVKDVTVDMLNVEAVSEDDATQYVSKVALKTTKDLGLVDEVYVIVGNAVQSYAGIPMAETFTQKLDVEKKVREIVADETYNVGYEQTQTITVGALPNDASKGKTLMVKAASDLIASIVADNATVDDNGYTLLTLDENGQATLTVNGELFGTTALNFKMMDSDVSAQSLVNVLDPAKLVNVKDAVASRISGTAVYRGQTVTLSCETEGATIYYTLDGSCPCDEATRVKYDGKPIAINGDMTLKVMAVGVNGSESEVKEYTYTIKQTQLQLNLAEGWNWTSHNQLNSLAADALRQDYVNRVLTQTAEVYNDPILGFVGNMPDVDALTGIKVETKVQGMISCSGEQFNPNAYAVDLVQGWNWIGYPLDQTMTVAEALSKLEAEEGDCLTNLEGGYANFTDGAWTGTLNTMIPGQGYLYKSASDKSFIYNDDIVSNAKAIYSKRLDITPAPWTVDVHGYPNMMCLTAELYDNGARTADNEFFVGAFVGDECRGIGKYVGGTLYMAVYGGAAAGEQVMFRAVERESGEQFAVQETMEFTADVVGTSAAPYALNLGEATGITSINADGKYADGIYNVAGQRMRSLDREGVYIVNGKKVLINKRNMNEYVK